MKNHFKRLLSLVMALLMVAALLPVSALAEEITWTEVDNFTDLKGILANTGGNIRLTADIVAPSDENGTKGQLVVQKATTLDFNGHTVTLTNAKTEPETEKVDGKTVQKKDENGNLLWKSTTYPFLVKAATTLMDSTNTDGGMTMTPSNYVQFIRVSGGSLTINSGKYSYSAPKTLSTNGFLIYAWHPVTINGGTLSATTAGSGEATVIKLAKENTSKLTIAGGSFTATTASATARGIDMESNATVTMTIPSTAKQVDITAKSTTGNAWGISTSVKTQILTDNISVTAQTSWNGSSNSAAVKHAYAVRSSRDITITGGTYTAEALVTTASKASATALKNERISADLYGTANISGGTFEATAIAGDAYGLYATYAKNVKLTGDVQFIGSDYSVRIDDGTGNVIEDGYYEGTVSAAASRLTINGGAFKGPEGVGVTDVAEFMGTTKYDQDDNGKLVALGTVEPRYEVTTNGNTTKYTSHYDMVNAVNADKTGNAKVKLLRDVAWGKAYTFKTAVDIDLNQYSWIQSHGIAITIEGESTDNRTTHVHDGMVMCSQGSGAIYLHTGSLHLSNLVAYATSAMPVCYYPATDTEALNANNLIENCTLITNRYYVFSYRKNTAQTNVEMTFKNTNLINLYTKNSGDDIFFNGSKDTTGAYILDENVNMYVIFKDAAIGEADSTVKTPVVGTVHERLNAAQYADVNEILATIGQKMNYKDGQTVGTSGGVFTQTPSLYKWTTEHTYVDGVCSCGATSSKPAATIGEVKYESITEALDAAKEGETVVLQKDINVNEDLVVVEDVTLDLNGKNVTAGSLTVFGALVDGNKGGKALIIADNFHVIGGYLPIYDSANGGYRVFKYEVVNMGTRAAGENAAKFGFRLTLDNADGYALLATGESKLKLTASVSWTGTNNNKFDYPFKDATVKAYGEALVSGRTNATIVLTVSGLDILGENGTFTMTPSFATTVGMNAVGTSSTWTAANA